jgi:hypothetical protein
VSGVVQIVTGSQVSVSLGEGSKAKTVTLDVSVAQVYAGHPPVAAGASAHTAVLDLSAATVYTGTSPANATVTTVSSLNVGDRVYAVLSVSSDVASADAQSGTPIPVSKLYDAGPPQPSH